MPFLAFFLMKRKLPYILDILLRSKMDLPHFLEFTEKTWIRTIRENAGFGFALNHCGSATLGRGEPLNGTLKNLENDD